MRLFLCLFHIGAILSKKCYQKWGVGTKHIKGGWSIEGGFKLSAYYGIPRGVIGIADNLFART